MDNYSGVIIWLASIAATLYFAKKWEMKWILWGILSVFIGPVAMLIVGIIRYNAAKKEEALRQEEEKLAEKRRAEERRKQAELEELRRIEEERLALQKEAEEEYLLEKAEKIAIIKEVLSDADIKAGVISAASCPSCGATFKAVGAVAVCPYCESVVSVD